MSVRPHNDWVLIQYDPEKRITVGGIIKPEGAHDEVHEWGTVIAVGPGKWYDKVQARVPPEVKPGDRVYYIKFLKNTHTGQSLRATQALSEDLFLIQEKDVIVVEQDGEGAA